MQPTLRFLAIANGLFWMVLLVRNAVLHFFYGWGQTPEVILFGSIPILGLLIEAIIIWLYRSHRFRVGVWIAAPAALLALCYMLLSLMPGFA